MDTTTAGEERLQSDTRALLRMLTEGGTLAGLYGLAADELEALYSVGLGQYNQARWDEAQKVFGQLVTLRHGEPRYLNALAATHQMRGEHAKAVHYYGLSQLLAPKDPAPTFHTAHSLLALGLVDDAVEALQIDLRQCDGDTGKAALAQRAQALLDLVSSRVAAAA